MEIHDDQLSLSVFLSRSAIKSYIVPSLVWRKCVLKVTVLIFFLALQSIAAFCHMLGVWCVSAVQKKQERKNRSPVDSAQVWDKQKDEASDLGGGGKRMCECIWVKEPNEVTLAGSAHRPGLSHDNQITHISQKEAEQFTLTRSSTSLSSGGDRWELDAAFLL